MLAGVLMAAAGTEGWLLSFADYGGYGNNYDCCYGGGRGGGRGKGIASSMSLVFCSPPRGVAG
jgi:hypothetical protein